MKFALIFLSCFIGLSYQERYIWPMPYAPRAHLMPLFYADGQPADIEALPEIQELDNQPKNEPAVVQDEQQSKLLNLVLPSAVTNFKPFTTTTTILSSTTTVISTPTTVKCIASTVFLNTNATTACARRRREVEDQSVHLDQEAIEPAVPAPLEATAVETLPIADVKEISLVEPEIESSQMNLAADDTPDSTLTEERLLFTSLTSTVSVTKTTIITSYAGATIQATIDIAGASKLNCLPAGYKICA